MNDFPSPPPWLLPAVSGLWLAVTLVLGTSLGDARQAAATCAQAVDKADEVVSSTSALGLAMVEHAETEEWHARSLAAANVEHLTASLEVEVPRYEALRDECAR